MRWLMVLLLLWDSALGQEARLVVQTGHGAGRMECVAVSPNEKWLVTGGEREVVLWDIATQRQIRRIGARTPTRVVMAPVFTPDGKSLLTGGRDVRQWEIPGGRALGMVARPRKALPSSAAVSPRGALAAVVANDGSLLLANLVERDQPVRSLDVPGRVTAVAWISPGVLAAGARDGRIHIVDVAKGDVLRTLEGHEAPVACIVPTGDARLVSAGQDGVARVWDTGTGVQVGVRSLGPGIRISARADAMWPMTGLRVERDSIEAAYLAEGKARTERWPLDPRTVTWAIASEFRDRGTALVVSSSGWARFLVDHRTLPLWSGAFQAADPIATSRDLACTVRVVGASLEITRAGEPGARTVPLPGRPRAVALAPDGRHCVVGLHDGFRVLDTGDGRTLFTGWSGAAVSAAAVSAEGRIAVGRDDGVLAEWQLDKGEELRNLGPMAARVRALAYSPDAAWLAASDRAGNTRLWSREKEVGLELKARGKSSVEDHFALPGTTESVLRIAARFLAFSEDSSLLFTFEHGGTGRLFDLKTGRQKAILHDTDAGVTHVAAMPAGSLLGLAQTAMGQTAFVRWPPGGSIPKPEAPTTALAVSERGTWIATVSGVEAILREPTKLTVQKRFRGEVAVASSVACTPDGRSVIVGDGTRNWIWDLARGSAAAYRLEGEIRFSHGGAWAIAATRAGPFITRSRVYDAASLDLLHESSLALDVTGDGKLVTQRGIRDLRTGESTNVRPGGQWGSRAVVRATCVARSVVVLPSTQGGYTLLDADSGEQTQVTSEAIEEAVVSPTEERITLLRLTPVEEGAPDKRDGSRLRMNSHDGKGWRTYAREWSVHDLNTGKRLFALESPEFHSRWGVGRDTGMVYSRSGFELAMPYRDGVRVWDARTGAVLASLPGNDVTAVTFLPSGRLAACSGVGTTAIWDWRAGQELCRMVCFENGGWAVVDSHGRYDASNGGSVKGLHWVIDSEPVELEQLKGRYYDPGLLAKHLGANSEPLREVEAFEDPQLFPSLRVERLGEGRLRLHLVNRGGGIGRAEVRVNGKERTADARAPSTDDSAASLTIDLDIAGDPRLRPGDTNDIEVFAYNREGYLRSRGVRFEHVAPGSRDETPPELWAVVAGVSDYRGDTIDLNFAAKDAADFARALELAAAGLFGGSRLHLTRLLDSGTPATAANLRAALKAAEQARPNDVFLLYLAGHGVNYGAPDEDFHFLTADAQSADLQDPEVRRTSSISSSELTELVKRIPVSRQVMILDTCSSGTLVAKLTTKRDVPGSQKRALERLKDRTGMHILAGCAADRVSYETTRFGQGLLTYSLLLGMRGAALRGQEYVDVGRLFAYAADKVPELAEDIGGVQRPVVAAPRGAASFDIGRVTPEDAQSIPLNEVRPFVVQSAFQDEATFADGLKLARALNRALDDESSRGRAARLAYVDAPEFPGAYRVVGRYRVKDARVELEVRVLRADRVEASFEFSAPASDTVGAAGTILRRLIETLADR